MIKILIPFRQPQKAAAYSSIIEQAGAEPVSCHVEQAPSLKSCQGLLLTGGTDINPELYAQDRRPDTDAPDTVRDSVEMQLLSDALELDLPVLAICRGMQLLNVHHGGSLVQHLGLEEHDSYSANQAEPVHMVSLDPRSHLFQIYGQQIVAVNSRHHQAVDKLGENLRETATCKAEPHVVEAIESPTRKFVVGVQWHPEDQAIQHPEHMRLFLSFVKACRDNSRR